VEEIEEGVISETALVVHSFEILMITAVVVTSGSEEIDAEDMILLRLRGHLNSPDGIAAARAKDIVFECAIPHNASHHLAFGIAASVREQCQDIAGRVDAKDMPNHPG
jgi:hypothetical protein